MRTAHFAKYNKTNLHDAIIKIEKLKQSNATKIEYNIVAHFSCSEEDVQKVFNQGTILCIDDIAAFGINSIGDYRGVWQCIKLSYRTKDVLIYTAGSSSILYYSFL